MAEFDKIILNGTTYTIPEGGGGSVTVDDAITSGSTNPVENNAIYNAVNITDKAIYTYEPVNGEALLSSSSRFYIGKTARFIFYNWVYPKAYTYIRLRHSGQYIWYKITDWNDWENNPPVMQYATSSFTESSFTFGNLTPNKSFTVTNNSTYDLWGNIVLYTTYNEVASGVDPGTVLDFTDYWLCPGVIQFEKDTTYSGSVKETAASIKDILPVPIYKADNSGYLFTETGGNLRVKRAYFNPLTGEIYYYSNDYQNVLKIDTVDFSYSTNDGLKFVKSQYSPSSSPALEVTDVDEWQQSEISTNIYFSYHPIIIFRFSGNGNASIRLSDGNNRNLSINISRDNSNLRADLNFNHGDVSSDKNLTYYTGLDEITVPFEVLGLSSEQLTGPITVQNQWIEPGFVESFSVYQSSEKVSFDIWQQKTDYLLGQQEIKEEVTSRALNYVNDRIGNKQDTLVSGTNIKTINNESILGSGNITIQGEGASYTAGEGIDITNDVITNTRKQRVLTFEDSATGIKAALRVISPHWDYSEETVSDPANDLTFVNNVPAANADPYVQANYLDGTLMEFEITYYSEDGSSNFSFDTVEVSGGVMLTYNESEDEWVDEVENFAIFTPNSFTVGMKIRMNSTMLSALLTAMQADCPYSDMSVQYKTYAWDTNKSVNAVHSGTSYPLAYNSDLTALAARVTALETAVAALQGN